MASQEQKFPPNFIFGVGSSCYQVEGGAKSDGKGESMIDKFVHTNPEHIMDHSNGDVACNTYNLYKEDTQLLKDLGVDFYRFSISWTRILPNGDDSKINEAGIKYYNDLIDNLLDNGIQPFVTMHHWDLPQALQDLGGWTNPIMADYFEDFARVLFDNFADRVKYWCTINEPRLFSSFAYGRSLPIYPLLAPGIEMPGVGEYLACHTLLLAHAKAYHLYKNNYQELQTQGRVGIVVDGFFFRPSEDVVGHQEAADRGLLFELGWVLHPIFKGDYPPEMREAVDRNSKKEGRRRSRLPKFTEQEIKLLKGSADFIGLNHYTTYVVEPGSPESAANPSHLQDSNFSPRIDPSSGICHPSWLSVEPDGLRSILHWIRKTYGNPEVIITENGCSDPNKLDDKFKVEYHKSYLSALLKAANEGCNVTGYTVWSFLDSFEWHSGYTEKFGLYHVDFNDPLRPRTAKKSAQFYKEFLKTRSIFWS